MSAAAETLRVGCYAVIGGGDSILLCRICEETPDFGRWTLPGGGMNFGEHPRQCAEREVLEETGLTVELGGVLFVDSFVITRPSDRLHVVQIAYSAASFRGELRSERDGTTDLCEWFTRESAASLDLVPLARSALIR